MQEREKNKKLYFIPVDALRNCCTYKLEQGDMIKRNPRIKSSRRSKTYKLGNLIFALNKKVNKWNKKRERERERDIEN